VTEAPGATSVRTRYWLESRLRANRDSRRRFEKSAPALGTGQRAALDQLRARGIAIVPFDSLVGDSGLWETLAEEMARFERKAEKKTPQGEGRRELKADFLIRDRPKRLESDDPWLRLGTSAEILSVVNAYRGLLTKLVDFQRWYTVPFPEARERVKSQRWHRDPEDKHVVKVFVYFSDVDEEAGPFQYVPGSATEGRYRRFRPWKPTKHEYPTDEEWEARVGAGEELSATGPAGTVILCDTTGFHRGGLAISSPRVLSTYTYVSPASLISGLKERRFKVDWKGNKESFPTSARYALR
jgi:Phytanoyl-CoA dioxygenase (PhyH)